MKDKNIQIFISATFFITVYFALMYSFEVHLNTIILNPVYLSKLNDKNQSLTHILIQWGFNIHMKNPSCEDLAEFLMKTTSKLVIKHNFTLKDCTKGSNYYTEMFKMAEPCKMPENAYSIINSVTFVRREKFLDNEGSASTSKVEYKLQ